MVIPLIPIHAVSSVSMPFQSVINCNFFIDEVIKIGITPQLFQICKAKVFENNPIKLFSAFKMPIDQLESCLGDLPQFSL